MQHSSTLSTQSMLSHRSVILVSDSACDDARAALCAFAIRPPRRLSFQDAQTWVDEGRTADLVHIELGSTICPATQDIVRRVDAHTGRTNTPLIVAGPLSSIDVMAEAAASQAAHWLCEPTLEDRLAQTALVFACNGDAFGDVATDIDALRLRRLADEVSRIARALSSLSTHDRTTESYAASAVAEARPAFRGEPLELSFPDPAPSVDEIRTVLRLRRLRERFFDPALFADPAWDMLLDLMAARLEGAQVAVSSLCIAAAVPPTTALRWIKTMTDHAIFERCADPDDGRRIFIRLSDVAMMGMSRYFQSAKKLGGLMI